jgi:hypothetical protein
MTATSVVELARPSVSDPHWRRRAACDGTPIDMVPGGEDENDEGQPLEIARAKKVCVPCPVRGECGWQAIEMRWRGVWGGLTFAERERLRLSLRPKYRPRVVQPCSACDLPCVPLYPDNPKCDLCLTEDDRPRHAADYREQIEAMIDENLTYAAIADRLKLTKSAVSNACNRWGKTSRAGRRPGPVPGGPDLRPCGTAAARVRHARAGIPRDQWDCACRLPIIGAGRHKKKTQLPQEQAEPREQRQAA